MTKNKTIPGETIRWGKERKERQPSLANTPQLLKGGCKPKPIKLRKLSNKIFAGIEFPDPGGSDFANAELVSAKIKKINNNRK